MSTEHAETLGYVINSLKSDEDVDYLQILDSIHSMASTENAPSILGVVVGLQGREIKIAEEKKPSFLERLRDVKQALGSLLPAHLQRLIPSGEVRFLDESTDSGKEKNLIKALENLVIDVLIKTSKHEIWNSLNMHFNGGDSGALLHKSGLMRHLFKYLTTASRINGDVEGPEECMHILKEMAYLASEWDVDTILELFLENPQHFGAFLIILRGSNREVYDLLKSTICTEKKYFKEPFIAPLPDIDFAQIAPFIKDYNWEVTASLLQAKPALAKDLIASFQRDELGISKRFFIDAIQKQGDIFSNYISDLNLTSEELVDICTRSYNFTKKYFYHIETEEQMLQFCKILAKREEARILAFLKEIESIPTFELFLKTLLKTCRLTGDLKSYIVSNYADSPAYFNSLLSYLEISNIEGLLEKYYERNTTIEQLLRRFYPQELIIEIHRFKDTTLASNLISDCIDNPKFEDKDWVLAMKSLEAVFSFSKAATSLMMLKRKPNLRAQTINLLKKTVCDSLWDSPTASDDFIKCLELLREDCLVVFDAMTKSEIIFVMQKSRQIENTVRAFFANYSGTLPSNLTFVWNCLRMI